MKLSTPKLLKSTLTVGSMTLLSRVLGLVRDMVVANIFGPGIKTDAFFVAFKIPNFLRRLFAEGAFSQAFVPVLTEYKTQKADELKQLIDEVAGTLSGILMVVTILGVLGASVLVSIFAPGFIGEPQRLNAATDMLRITFPYLMLISLTAYAGSLLNTFGRFAVPAFTPVLLNLCLISSAIWLAPLMDVDIYALAWGVMIAGIVQLLFQLPFLAQAGLLPRPRWGWKTPGVQKIRKLMLPAIFGSSVAQINLLFDTLIASFLVAGSVSWLYFSDRMIEFPLGIFGIALATVILPRLSHEHAETNPEQFSKTLDWGLRLGLLIGLPSALGLMFLAEPILSTLFQYGKFVASDTNMASYSLMAYACGLPGFFLIKILAPGFYARQDTKTPVKIGIIAMLVNMLLNVLFVVPMVKYSFVAPHAGLAIATSLSAFLNAYLLLIHLRRDGVYHPSSGWWLFTGKLVLACIGMALLMNWLHPGVEQLNDWSWYQRAINLGYLVTAGVISYLGILLVTGIRPQQLGR